MHKSYSSNLTREQFELLRDLIPDPKPGGRPRSVEMRSVLNAIFYSLTEGC
jgi:transposase